MLSALTPPPTTSATPAAPVTPQTPSPATPLATESCCSKDKKCAGCLKGGLPMRKELSSFLLLFFLGACVVLGILLINAKRELLSKSTPVAPPVAKAAPDIQTTLPKERTYVKTVALPQPKEAGSLDVEAALAQRRSRRTFDDKPVTLAQLSQMLWAGQGITDPEGNKRTAPSARNVYFFSIFVVVRDVDGLEPGLYEYLPEKHALGNMQVADAGALLTEAGVQDAAQKSPVVFLLSAAYGKGAESMKESAKSSALLEGGHIGQNLYLQAESLQMATVAMAGFDAAKVGSALQLDPAETVVYIYPFGHQAPETAEESTHE